MKIITARQEVKNNMYDVVIDKGNANIAVIGTNVALASAFDEFKTVVAKINLAKQSSAAVTTGLATDKKVSKNTLSRTASIIAGQIFAFAAKNKNNLLKEAVDFSATDLRRLKDEELVPRCQEIHSLGTTNRAALTDYGVTNAALTELQTEIEAYAANVPKPRSAQTDRSTVKLNLKNLFAEADEILVEQMDRLVEAMSKTDPDFVNTYKSARVIIEPKAKKKPDGTNGGNNTPA